VRPWTLLLPVLGGLAAWAGEATPLTLSATTDLLTWHDLLATGPDRFAPAPRPGQFQYSLSLQGNLGPWTGGATLRDINFHQPNPRITLDRATTSMAASSCRTVSTGWT